VVVMEMMILIAHLLMILMDLEVIVNFHIAMEVDKVMVEGEMTRHHHPIMVDPQVSRLEDHQGEEMVDHPLTKTKMIAHPVKGSVVFHGTTLELHHEDTPCLQLV